jgi:hypothetical protein
MQQPGIVRPVQNVMLSWQQSAGLGVALAGAGLGLRPVRRPWVRIAAAFAVEASLIAALYSVWQYMANRSVSDRVGAIHNAEWLVRLQTTLHLPSEHALQHVVLPHRYVVEAANLYYDTMHFTAIFVFLLWLFFWHRDRYGAVRTVLAIATLTCLIISFVPVAPPRLLPGYVDTAAIYGQSVYGGSVANELSAMPSVHVAWAVLIAWYAMRIGRGRWRLLGPAHAVVTTIVVVVTANHWWLDGVVAVAVLVASAWAYVGVVRGWTAWRLAAPLTAAGDRPLTAGDRPLTAGDLHHGVTGEPAVRVADNGTAVPQQRDHAGDVRRPVDRVGERIVP